jgi:hypothetical protein
MGGAVASRFEVTDWDKEDGGVSRGDSIDGTSPTLHHTILTLKKKNLVNQREFEVRNDQDLLLYKSHAVEGTTKEFSLWGMAENSELFRVIPDVDHTHWIIYGHNRLFEGQVPSKDNRWYKVAVVTIAWDHCHADVKPMVAGEDPTADPTGVPAKEALLKVETIKSLTAQYQSFRPSSNGASSLLHPPLNGHWIWEHTQHSHQLKMHLCKGCDQALHCLLAVITNLVTVEHQANQEQ